MSKKRDKKSITTNVSSERFEELSQVIESEDLGTMSMLIKHAITLYCQQKGYEHIDLVEDTKSWGGRREGSGRPPIKDENSE